MATVTLLTVADIARARSDDRWLGWGYLGERERTERQEDVPTADTLVVDEANRRGWDYDTLFGWANSKGGRWYGDVVFGRKRGASVESEHARAIAFGLFEREGA